jgi:hypothetical protein
VKVDQSPSTELTLRASDAPHLWDDVRLQKLWLALERRTWHSLAVLGASRSINSLHIAEMIAQLAWRYRGQPSSVSDLRDLSMRLIDYEVREMRAQVASGTRLVVALRSVFENPTAAPIAKHVDGVLLIIAVDNTKFKEAEETIVAVGRDRVLGTILLRPRMRGQRSSANGQ